MSPSNSGLNTPIANRLLAALPIEEYQRLHPHLEPISLKLKEILYAPGMQSRYVYFPSNAIISLVSAMHDGRRVEVGLVGSEGMVSTSSFMGGDGSPNEGMVQVADGGLRMKTEVLVEEFNRGGPLQVVLLRYAQSLFIQVAQCAACNRLHSIEKRLARWLLMVSDRTKSERLMMTQELLAIMLGSERSGVTLAAITLQDEGLIAYSRGRITIPDRSALADAACECYPIIKHTFDHFLDGYSEPPGTAAKQRNIWSAAAWRRFSLPLSDPIGTLKRRQAAALQILRGSHLFVSQGDHWVDFGCAPGRDVTGYECHCCQN